MQRFLILAALLLGLSSCKGDGPLFLGGSVGKPVPSPGTEQAISDLLPISADVVCNFGPFTYGMPGSVPERYRTTIANLGIFPVSEIEGYFVYLTEHGTVIGFDLITYRGIGYNWSSGDQNGRFRCRDVAKVKVGVRTLNERRYIYLTAREGNL